MDNLSFNKQEMAAIIKLAKMMAAADGRLDKAELSMMSKEALRFGITPDDFVSLLKLSDNIKTDELIATVLVMTNTQKRYIAAYLGTMMAIDGDIDDKEMELWQFISLLCELPTMTVLEAIEYMDN